jgi:Chemotaxis phosphatase CheX
MMTESIPDLLASSAEDVLGTMFFTPVIGRDDTSASEPSHLAIRLCFLAGGSRADQAEASSPAGHLDLEVSREGAQCIAASFLAADGTVPEFRVNDVLCELANVICGNVMSIWASESGFALLSPEVIHSSGEEWPNAQAFEEWFELERGWLKLKLALVKR